MNHHRALNFDGDNHVTIIGFTGTLVGIFIKSPFESKKGLRIASELFLCNKGDSKHVVLV